jgi:hypothetical protein
MRADPDRLVDVEGRQFDHWAEDTERRSQSIVQAIEWIVRSAGLSASDKA